MTITDSPSLKPAPVMSFAFFARQLDPNQPAPIFSKNDYRVGFYGTQVSGNRFIAFIAGGRSFGVASPGDTNWHHFAIVVTNGAPTPAFYIDGVPQNLLPGYKDGLVEMRSSDDPLVLVSDQPGAIELDELQIYRVGLTAPQVAALASGAMPEPANALSVASYAMPNGGGNPDFHDNSYTGGTGDPTLDGSALAGGAGELTDGVQALYSISGTGPNLPWVIWNGISPVITFDFGGTRSVNGLRLTVEVEVFRYLDASFSDDGVHFGPAQRFFPDARSAKRVNFSATLPFELIGFGRYARLSLERGSGSPAVSEVSFLGYTPQATKPHFVTEPADLAGHQGATATLESFAEGVAPLTYQWRYNGAPISGATNRQFILSYPYPADSGAYSVVALNSLGATTSRVAQVIISPDIVPGAFDHSFLPPVDDARLGFLTNFTAQVNVIVRQTDGKLLLGGNPPNAGGTPPNGSLIRVNPDGSPDPSFVPRLQIPQFAKLALQADGKIILTASGQYGSSILRLNPDGSLDPTFSDPTRGGNNAVLALPDGRLLIGGILGPTVGGLPRSNLVRLKPDGAVDPDFAPVFNGETYDIALDIEGNYLVVGTFTSVNGIARPGIVRLLPDGTVDPGFQPAYYDRVTGVWALPDGRILVREGGFHTRIQLRRLLANGITDPTFSYPAGMLADKTFVPVQPLPDGSVVVFGNDQRVHRLLEDGQDDPAFSVVVTPRWNADPGLTVVAIALEPDGRVVLGGNFIEVNGVNQRALARVQGSRLLPTWNIGFSATEFSEFELTDHATITLRRTGDTSAEQSVFVLSGEGSAVPGTDYEPVAESVIFAPGETEKILNVVMHDDLVGDGTRTVPLRLLAGDDVALAGPTSAVLTFVDNERPPGSIDLSFDANRPGTPPVPEEPQLAITALAEGAGGKVFVAMGRAFENTLRPVIRLLPDGSPDTGFNFPSGLSLGAGAVAPTPNGGVVFTGYNRSVGLIVRRLLESGAVDPSFQTVNLFAGGSDVSRLLIDPQGRILLTGGLQPVAGVHFFSNLVRLLPDGSLDAGFTPNFNGQTTEAVIDASGRYVVAGLFTQVDGNPRGGLVRLRENGVVDPDFNPPDLGQVLSVFLVAGGKLLVSTDAGITRLLPDGSRDDTFKVNFGELPERFTGGLPLRTILALPDGRVLVNGRDGLVWRLNADGSLDAGYTSAFNGYTTEAVVDFSGRYMAAMTIQADGKVLMAATFSTVNGFSRKRIVRLTAGTESVVPLAISGQPADQATAEGRNAAFEVTVGGGGPYFYQWQFRGTNLPGEVSPTLTLLSVNSLNEGEYRVLVKNPIGSAMSRSATLTVLPKPANDVFAKRYVLGTGNIVTNGYNIGAAKETGEPLHGGTGNKSVWYSWTASGTAQAAARLTWTGPQRFTVAVYRGTSLFALTSLGKAANPSPASVRFTPTAGTTYQVAVDGFTVNDEGAFQLEVGAAVQGDPPTIATDPQGGTFLIGQPIRLSVTANSSVPPNFQWRRNTTDLPGANAVSLNYPAARPELGGDYRVVVGNEFGSVTSAVAHIVINVQPPANDAFANASPLNGRVATASGFNFLASAEPGETAHAGAAAARSVWWKWTAPEAGLVSVHTGGSEGDTRLAAYTGPAVNQLALVAQDDNSGPGGGAAKVGFASVAGTTYFFAVDTVGGTEGAVSLTLGLNPFPLVGLTAPAGGTSFIVPTNIVLTAIAGDDDGVARVEFFAGTNLLGTVTNPPYALDWTNPPVGEYLLTARATDQLGAVGNSAAVPISVSEPSGPATFRFLVASSTNLESDPAAVVTVVKSSGGPAKVNYSTERLNAEVGRDYRADSGFLEFGAGSGSQTITIPLLNDYVPDGDKQFQVRLSPNSEVAR